MLEQLDARPGHSVLEIGTGTGYNAALLAFLVGQDGRVLTIDIAAELVDDGRERLARTAATQVDVLRGDGADGWAGFSSYRCPWPACSSAWRSAGRATIRSGPPSSAASSTTFPGAASRLPASTDSTTSCGGSGLPQRLARALTAAANARHMLDLREGNPELGSVGCSLLLTPGLSTTAPTTVPEILLTMCSLAKLPKTVSAGQRV
jgi:Protein-L-isoaspartate(D-aspartate) O-methyltransferase (PCMT)